jgi:hypothetical protein
MYPLLLFFFGKATSFINKIVNFIHGFFFLAISHIPVYSSSSVRSRMPSLVETGSRIETDFDFIQSVKSRMSSLVKTRSRIGTVIFS